MVQAEIPAAHSVIGGVFTVDLTTGHVRNDEQGLDSFSAVLGELQSDMSALRMPPVLSEEQTCNIAQHVSAFTSRLVDNCLAAQSYYTATAEQALIGLVNVCTHTQVPNGPVILVNIRTGAIEDPSTHADLTTPESRRITNEMLRASIEQQQRRRQTLVDTCKNIR
jgi:hypothetical protein